MDYALYHLILGETDRAFEYLTLLAEQRHPFLMMVLVGGAYEEAIRSSLVRKPEARKPGLPRRSAKRVGGKAE